MVEPPIHVPHLQMFMYKMQSINGLFDFAAELLDYTHKI